MQANRRKFLCAALGTSAAVGLGTGWSLSRHPRLTRVERTSRALGSEVSITACHGDRSAAEAALDEAFAELELVEEVMSLYRPHSQLCQLNRDQVLNDPHPYLVQVLGLAQRLSADTKGAFDVTVQGLWSLQAAAHKSGKTPSPAEIAAARSTIDWRRVEVSPTRVRLTGHSTAVTLNGIAQGFAADRALAALRSHGVEHALVNTGEIGSLGNRPDEQRWTTGIQHPRVEDAYMSLVELDGRCLATSGDYATSFSDDHTSHHIFDPRTGRSPQSFSSVSVLAPSGLLADGLSTALFVLGLEEGLKLIDSINGVDALYVAKDGRTHSTPGFPEQV